MTKSKRKIVGCDEKCLCLCHFTQTDDRFSSIVHRIMEFPKKSSLNAKRRER